MAKGEQTVVTVKELAVKAGVSIGTVDRVLHNRGRVKKETEERVLAAIKELKYTPNQVAQGLAARKKKLKIIFLIPGEQGKPYYRDIRLAAEEKARELRDKYGVNVRFLSVKITGITKEILSELEEADGMITLGLNFPGLKQCLDTLEEQRKPVVFYNILLEGQEYLAYVGCDYIQAGKIAAGLCALVGGRDAKIFIYSEGLGRSASADKRILGLRQEMKERYPNMQVKGCQEILPDYEELRGTVVKMLEKSPDVNIVYIANPADYSICSMIHEMDNGRSES